MSKNWLLYGANGYSGKLIINEALERGHQPILAGRSQERIASLAQQYKLEQRIFDTASGPEAIEPALENVSLVCNAAGPFVHTAFPIVSACLKTKTHYVDITGEIPVFERVHSYHHRAKKRGIAFVSGVGFDVVPTDCLAKYTADKLPDATELEIDFEGLGGGFSRGTLLTMLEHISRGILVRKNRHLINKGLAARGKTVEFPGHSATVFPITWGDLSTAYHSTGIPNIEIYAALKGKLFSMNAFVRKLVFISLKNRFIRSRVMNYVKNHVTGPGERERREGHSHIRVWVRNEKGDSEEAWLITVEGYRFTALASVRSVEKVLEGSITGALTPSQAFGADFVLEIPNTKRFDSPG
ncbi:MAG: NAD(P)H-binding protein [Chitinivibrionales bacterium]|nr:NAD(P)H-binding protein [Chitinivibrionales bacterium]